MSGRSLATAITVAAACGQRVSEDKREGQRKDRTRGRTKDGVEDEEEEDGRGPLKGQVEGLSGRVVGSKVEKGATNERDRDAFDDRREEERGL